MNVRKLNPSSSLPRASASTCIAASKEPHSAPQLGVAAYAAWKLTSPAMLKGLAGSQRAAWPVNSSLSRLACGKLNPEAKQASLNLYKMCPGTAKTQLDTQIAHPAGGEPPWQR